MYQVYIFFVIAELRVFGTEPEKGATANTVRLL